MVVFGEPDYPVLLTEIFDPPLALFIAGEPLRLKEFMAYPRIAIVGSRASTSYGTDAAHLLAAGLSRKKVCIVSGMAVGIDAVAHKAALPEQGGTIAVLGCGTDIVYPRTNRAVFDELLKNGLVVSEYPPGTEPRPWRFPARNRIIAGLSDGVIVVEAAEKSGALITADFCLEAGRDVFAVPGSIFARVSGGTNRLIQSGAAVATSADDVMEAMGFNNSGGRICDDDSDAGLDDMQRKVLRVLGPRPLPVDVVAIKTGMDIADVLTRLMSLELTGRIRFEPGRGYCR
jgi:DNA processing protein